MSKRIQKIVIFFVEGQTEVPFYEKMIGQIRKDNGGRLSCKVRVINANGIGNFSGKICRVFEQSIKKQYPDHEYHVLLCYDTDVFELGKKPPVDWQKVTRLLLRHGVTSVHEIRARKSIEDWFLYDIEGICSYLKLKPKDIKGTFRGTAGLQQLFKKGHKLYIKGSSCDELIQALDIEKIMRHIEDEIKEIKCML